MVAVDGGPALRGDEVEHLIAERAAVDLVAEQVDGVGGLGAQVGGGGFEGGQVAVDVGEEGEAHYGD